MSIITATIAFIAATYGFGFVYAVVSKANQQYLITAVGWKGFCLLGLIGVPFHEFSHLITALIFRHKITDFSLYRPVEGKKDGTLGYVNHTYNRKSAYQCVGNFFIGSAPMLFGAGLLMLLLYLAVPRQPDISDMSAISSLLVNFRQIITDFARAVADFNIFAWLTIICAVVICPHIGMSGADFKNVVGGTVSVIAASVAFPYMLNRNFGVSYSAMGLLLTDFVVRYIYILAIGLLISVFVMLIGKILSVRVT